MGIYSDLLGTLRSSFKVGGTAGVLLKHLAGNLQVRNAGDTADATLQTAKLLNTGNGLDLNSSAAGAGADWKLTLQRPAAGMTAAQTITLPAGLGSAGFAVVTDGFGNWSYMSTGSTASSDKLDTTSIAFGSASPVALFSTGAADIVAEIEVVIDTPFNGTPSLSVGIVGTTSKYLSATDVDLTAAAGTVFAVHPGLPAAGVEALIASYAAGGATAGSARVLVHFATPS